MTRMILLSAALATSLPAIGEIERGLASYYGDGFHGKKTASGEPYDKDALTAAHRTLAFGTEGAVTYIKTGKSTRGRINDRGPFVDDRIIDLSGAAARDIGLIQDGGGRVMLDPQ